MSCPICGAHQSLVPKGSLGGEDRAAETARKLFFESFITAAKLRVALEEHEAWARADERAKVLSEVETR